MRRRASAVLTAACLTVAIGGAHHGQAQPPPAGSLTTVNDLLVRFRVDKQAADIVLLVDTSGSMSAPPNAPYPDVLRAYRAFVNAASLSDFLSVVTFDSNAVPRFNGSLAGRGRATALTALPPVATGRATDIGAGLDGALARLSRPDSNDVQILLVLTDGRNDPANGSAYTRAFGGAGWARVVARAREQSRTHNVSVYGNGLTGIGQTDIGLVKKVFPSATLLGLPSSQLGSFFNEAITRARAEQLRRPVTKEVAEGRVHVEVVGQPRLGSRTTLRFRLRSTYEHLPVSVRIGELAVRSPDGRSVPVEGAPDGEVVTLEPGQSSKVYEVTAEVPFTARRWYQPSRTDRRTLALTLPADVTAQPDLLLRRTLGSRLDLTGGLEQPTPIEASTTTGLTKRRLLELTLAAALALVVLALLYRQFLWLPTLTGGLLDLDSEAYHPFRGKRQSVPGGPIEPVKTYGGRAEFMTRRGKPGRVYVRRLDDPVAVERFEIETKLSGVEEVRSLDRIVIGRAKFALTKRGRGTSVGG